MTFLLLVGLLTVATTVFSTSRGLAGELVRGVEGVLFGGVLVAIAAACVVAFA